MQTALRNSIQIQLYPSLLTGLALVLSLHSSLCAQENWTRFRGLNGTGVAEDNPKLPTTWSKTENVKWIADVPGFGWSCPIAQGNRVYLTTVVSDEENTEPSKGLYLGQGVREPAKGIHHWWVYCFDLESGREVWKHEAHMGRPKVPRHPKSTYAVETATTDGERLYVLFGDLGLYCYELEGKLLWSKLFEPKQTFLDYGAAASPVVHDGQVIVVYDNWEESWIASFDGKTGEESWRTKRNETHSWATPLVWENELRTEIVVPGKKKNRSYSLDGELLWEFDGKMSNLVIPSPFVAHGMCYIASGYVGDPHRPTYAVLPGASGDITPEDGESYADSPFIEWYQPRASSYNPSQIVYGEYLYTLYDRGFLSCHNALTGEVVYEKTRFAPGVSFTSSPWAYNGKLFFLSEDGQTFVVEPGPEYKILETNSLDELCLSTPAIAGDKLLLRTKSRLYCLSEGARLASKPANNTSQIKQIMEEAVESGETAGVSHLVVQNGKELSFEIAGFSDVEDQTALTRDTIVRIYSMSKPITSVAAMTLYEQGKFQLDDPVSKFIPVFENSRVFVKEGDSFKSIPSKRPISIRDVLRHTTGYAYNGAGNPELDKAYHNAKLFFRPPHGMLPPDLTITDAAEALVGIPAHHHPGERFTYGFSTDLLGRLIEVWSGKPLEKYLQESMFGPLEMSDTGFVVPPEKRNRFASCYTHRDGKLVIADKAESSAFNEGFAFHSGGGGLVSTISDYANFCQMLVDGGKFEDKRVLKEETLKLMFTDQLDGVAGPFRFGLGFAIGKAKLGAGDTAKASPQYSWGGYASTDFQIVPEEKMFQIVIQQHVPRSNELANRLIAVAYETLVSPAQGEAAASTEKK